MKEKVTELYPLSPICLLPVSLQHKDKYPFALKKLTMFCLNKNSHPLTSIVIFLMTPYASSASLAF